MGGRRMQTRPRQTISRLPHYSALFSFVVLLAGCGSRSDAYLLQNFERHESTFEEVRGMFVADTRLTTIRRNLIQSGPVRLISPPGDLDRVGLSPDRYAKYIRLCDSLGLQGGISRGE